MLKRGGGGGGGSDPDWAAMYRDAGGDLAQLTAAVVLELGRDNAAEWEGARVHGATWGCACLPRKGCAAAGYRLQALGGAGKGQDGEGHDARGCVG